MTHHPVATKLNTIADEIDLIVYERAEVIRGMIIALVARQHLLMVGKPGTAKSVLAEALISHIQDASLFKIQFDEYTTSDDVFGGLDITKLSSTGEQIRLTAGMLPEADLAFLDEFFNLNGATGHSTHTALNERVFSQAGQMLEIPLRSAILATNKVNTDQDYAAVWDRVHLRYEIGYLTSRRNRRKMAREARARMAADGRRWKVPAKTIVTLDELDVAAEAALALTWAPAAEDAADEIHDGLAAEGIELSDRRFVECTVAAAAAAFLHGHDEVKVSDLSVMTAMAWNLLDQRRKASEIVLSIADDAMKEALELADEFDKIVDAYRNVENLDTAHKARKATEAVTGLKNLTTDAVKALARTEVGSDSNRRLTALVQESRERQAHIMGALMGVDPSTIKVG